MDPIEIADNAFRAWGEFGALNKHAEDISVEKIKAGLKIKKAIIKEKLKNCKSKMARLVIQANANNIKV